jgi:hypothetical protein
MRAYPINFVGHGTVAAMTSRRHAIEACENYAKEILNSNDWDWVELEKHKGRLLTKDGAALEFKMHKLNEEISDA